ncbi:MAG: CrcB family protein [Candidatus Nanopelagicales bacterium]|nr:CrcB family protein [Candidatus Nanopelagicales bacterium]
MPGRLSLRILAVIAAGGALGSVLRVTIAELMGTGQASRLAATLTVNIVGALAIGIAYPWIRERSRSVLLQPFVVTGVLGGFTTFSTFAADVVVHDGQIVLVLGYLAATLIAGLLAVPIGSALHQRLRRSA